MHKQTIVIPVDFTEVTENAVRFGVQLSEKDQDNVLLLHIISSENDRSAAEMKLESIISKTESSNKANISFKVITGKVEDDISKLAEASEASLIVMGTHGEKRLERFFGSKALKTITDSKIPYVVVQKDTPYSEIHKIAMTIDLEKESVQVVKAAAALGKKFNAEVILVGGAHTDPDLKAKVNVNVKTSLNYLKESGVAGDFVFLERKNFDKNLLDYCKENGVSMIAATYYPDTFHILSEKFVQHLLENELELPVLTLDAMAVTKGSQYSFMSV